MRTTGALPNAVVRPNHRLELSLTDETLMSETTVASINERAAEEYFRRGLEAEKEGNHEKAVEFYERALNENPDHERRASTWRCSTTAAPKTPRRSSSTSGSAPPAGAPQRADEPGGPLRGQQPLRRSPPLPRRGPAHRPEPRAGPAVHEGRRVGPQPMYYDEDDDRRGDRAQRGARTSRSPTSSCRSAAATA